MNAPATKTETDEFDAAFDEFLEKGADTGDVPAEAEATEAAEDTEVSETEATEAAEAAEAEAGETVKDETDKATEESPAETETEEQEGADNVDWEAAFRALKSKVEKGEIESPKPSATESDKPVPEQEVYTSDEKKALEAYESDWPEVSKGEALRRRAEYRDLTKFIFEEVAKSLKPLYDYYGESSDDLQYRGITKVHGDYDAVYVPLQKWIAQQPAYVKRTYEEVAKTGTVDEVVDLISRFKKETGWKTSTPSESTPPEGDVKSSKGLPTTARQAAKSLGAVNTKRSAVTDARDPNDFDGAFKEFVEADTKR